MREQQVTGPLIYIAGKIAGMILAFAAVILLPRILGVEGYGRYSYWFGIISVYLVLLDCGAQPMLRRFLPELNIKASRQAKTFYFISQKLKIIPFIVLLSATFFTDQPKVYLLMLGTALFASLATNLSDIFYAYQRMGGHVIVTSSRRLMRLIFVPVFFITWAVPGIFAALFLSEFFFFCITIQSLKLLPAERERLEIPFLQYYKQGFYFFLVFFASTLIGRLPVFTATWLHLPMNEIGRIALCVDIIYFAFKELVNSITESIFPKLISFRVAGEKEKFRRLVGTNYRIVNIALGCILSLGLGLSSQFLGFLGGDFSVATYEFNLLLFSLFFNCWYLIHGQLLLIFNRSEVVITCQCAGLLVISLFYLFFHSTLMELCIGLLLASVVISALTYSVVSKLAVGEDTTIYFARLTFPICLVSLLLKLWSPHGLLQVGAAAIIAFIFYVSLVFLCRCLPETDIKFIRTTINNSWHR